MDKPSPKTITFWDVGVCSTSEAILGWRIPSFRGGGSDGQSFTDLFGTSRGCSSHRALETTIELPNYPKFSSLVFFRSIFRSKKFHQNLGLHLHRAQELVWVDGSPYVYEVNARCAGGLPRAPKPTQLLRPLDPYF